MGIYIKGMEMPKDDEILCIDIHPDGKVCIDLDLRCKQVASAAPVPEHGDLIDRDEMREIAISLLDKAVTDQEANAIREMWSRLGQMPVFIPAEGE